jgi:hypothetical protein
MTMQIILNDDTLCSKVALQFAQALVEGNYDDAHTLLTASLRSTLPPNQLRGRFEDMIDYWDGDPVNYIEVDMIDDWPMREPSDLGLAYVSIACDTNGEAVTVIISDMNDQVLIRSIEWGRP